MWRIPEPDDLECLVMPHVDEMAKLELDAIYELLSSDWSTNRESGMIGLQQFLEHVHVLQTHSDEHRN